jgi:hypothetical protein
MIKVIRTLVLGYDQDSDSFYLKGRDINKSLKRIDLEETDQISKLIEEYSKDFHINTSSSLHELVLSKKDLLWSAEGILLNKKNLKYNRSKKHYDYHLLSKVINFKKDNNGYFHMII